MQSTESPRDDATVGAVGEFGLIERIRTIVGPARAVIGIGDDTAVLEGPPGEYLLATVDMLVQDVHFRLRPDNGGSVGIRAFEVSASDIAAMGGAPTFALVSLAAPRDMPVAYLDDLFRGLGQAASARGASIVGGNVARIVGPLVIDLTLLGSVETSQLVRRDGARPGDVLAVTGSLGDAAAARLATERDLVATDHALAAWSTRYAVPRARVDAGRALASERLAHAMIDLSDGLSSDLAHLCDASAAGAVIDAGSLPISSETRDVARALGVSPIDLALSGGEDYELLVALPGENLQQAVLGTQGALTAVGEVVPAEQGIKLRTEGGELLPLAPGGWRHF